VGSVAGGNSTPLSVAIGWGGTRSSEQGECRPKALNTARAVPRAVMSGTRITIYGFA